MNERVTMVTLCTPDHGVPKEKEGLVWQTSLYLGDDGGGPRTLEGRENTPGSEKSLSKVFGGGRSDQGQRKEQGKVPEV